VLPGSTDFRAAVTPRAVVTHLNGDHRRHRDQRGGESVLFMQELENGEDYSQKSRYDENANFKAESKNRADEKRNNECHL